MKASDNLVWLQRYLRTLNFNCQFSAGLSNLFNYWVPEAELTNHGLLVKRLENAFE